MGTYNGTGWERNKRIIFDEIVMKYEKIRWEYPGELIADIIRYTGPVIMKLYEASRTYGADEYIELLDTFSDHRSLPVDNRTALYEGIKEVILRHGGYHKVDYIFQLYMGRKP